MSKPLIVRRVAEGEISVEEGASLLRITPRSMGQHARWWRIHHRRLARMAEKPKRKQGTSTTETR